MRKFIYLPMLMYLGCASTTVNKVETGIKADLSQCKPEEQELVHQALPMVADYAVCVAFNRGDTIPCQAQAKSLLASAKDSAIACGLALIDHADEQAHAAAVDGGTD